MVDTSEGIKDGERITINSGSFIDFLELCSIFGNGDLISGELVV